MSSPGPGSAILTDQQVDAIARRLAERIAGAADGGSHSGNTRRAPAVATRPELGEGVFATVDDAVAAATIPTSRGSMTSSIPWTA
mgnify:CR=1 FL=1